jgi:hypothetical protein
MVWKDADMIKRMIIVITVMGICLFNLACGSTSTPQPTESPGRAEITPEFIVTAPIPTIQQQDPPTENSQAIEFYARSIEHESIGNGLQNLSIALYGNNTNPEWMDVTTFLGGNLFTEQGFEYYAKGIPPGSGHLMVPPGFVFYMRYLKYMFEIPEGANPDRLTLSYHSCAVSPNEHIPLPYECNWHVATVDLDIEYPGPLPFDPAYGDIIIHGDSISVGQIATIEMGRPIIESDDFMRIPLVITNLHQGYPLELAKVPSPYLDRFSANLIREDGLLLGSTGIDVPLIGPMQSESIDAIFNRSMTDETLNFSDQNYWIIWQIWIEVCDQGTCYGRATNVAHQKWVTNIQEMLE